MEICLMECLKFDISSSRFFHIDTLTEPAGLNLESKGDTLSSEASLCGEDLPGFGLPFSWRGIFW